MVQQVMTMIHLTSRKETGGWITDKDLATIDQNGRNVLAGREEALIEIVLDSVDSEHTKRAHRRALRDFLGWCAQVGVGGLNKAVVQRYLAGLRDAGASASGINQRLSAIRKLGRELANNEALTEAAANGVGAIKGVRVEGQRTGRWLTKEQAQRLLNAPEVTSLKGKHDRAIKGGSTWRPSWTCTPARSPAGPCWSE
jgi:site-specific recombinase XerC